MLGSALSGVQGHFLKFVADALNPVPQFRLLGLLNSLIGVLPDIRHHLLQLGRFLLHGFIKLCRFLRVNFIGPPDQLIGHMLHRQLHIRHVGILDILAHGIQLLGDMPHLVLRVLHLLREHPGAELVLQLQPHAVHVGAAAVLPEVQRPVLLLPFLEIRDARLDGLGHVDGSALQEGFQLLPGLGHVPVHVHAAAFQDRPGDFLRPVLHSIHGGILAVVVPLIRQPLQVRKEVVELRTGAILEENLPPQLPHRLAVRLFPVGPLALALPVFLLLPQELHLLLQRRNRIHLPAVAYIRVFRRILIRNKLDLLWIEGNVFFIPIINSVIPQRFQILSCLYSCAILAFIPVKRSVCRSLWGRFRDVQIIRFDISTITTSIHIPR